MLPLAAHTAFVDVRKSGPVDRVRDVVVIGGGPAGSVAAALAAQAGLDVLLLEADAHPRTHVGESLLPGIIPILDAIGALEDVEAAGFGPKTGTTHLNWGTTPKWDLWFADTDLYDRAWLVDRGRFDHILFEAARRAGADGRQHAVVTEPMWAGERIAGVRWREGGVEHEARARWVIDASGQRALLARQMGIRTVIEGLQHQCSWAHFDGAGTLPPPREHQALFVAQPTHWLWFFPLGGGRASVGLVRTDAQAPQGERTSSFDAAVEDCAAIMTVLGGARRCTPVRTQRDWSYSMSRVCGPGWLLAGDASGFIDPVLSTGVFLAMQAAYRAAHTVIDCVGGQCAEPKALDRYQRNHSEVFGDLLRMVRFYYQQNLSKEDYFWESKRILVRDDTRLKPQKAFLILTSGLIGNLAFDHARAEAENRRHTHAQRDAPDLASVGEPIDDPRELGFVCVHMRHHGEGGQGALYFLIEPREPAEPTLFRTPHWHVNCVAPRHQNDPIRHPELQPHLRRLARRLHELDDREESLATFWARNREEIMGEVMQLPRNFELVRVFGE